jgi:hypothetical protein
VWTTDGVRYQWRGNVLTASDGTQRWRFDPFRDEWMRSMVAE